VALLGFGVAFIQKPAFFPPELTDARLTLGACLACSSPVCPAAANRAGPGEIGEAYCVRQWFVIEGSIPEIGGKDVHACGQVITEGFAQEFGRSRRNQP
jgi:hypothetical protein